MYFLDPDRGRARRARAADQARAAVRRRTRHAARTTRQAVTDTENHLRGRVVEATGGGRYRPESDVDLREHLHQVMAETGVPTGDVTVDVEHGVATLRGQVGTTSQLDQLVAAVAATPGVLEVQSYLHLPGEPAPNKAASSGS